MGRTKRLLLREIELRKGRVACPGCERPVDPSRLTKHHIRPRSAGGPTVLANLVLICRPCHDDVHARAQGAVHARLRAFLAARAAPGAFPPPPEEAPPEDGVRLFLVRAGAQLVRTLAQSRWTANPPFDPFWPVGRHFAPPEAEWGVVRFPPTAPAKGPA